MKTTLKLFSLVLAVLLMTSMFISCASSGTESMTETDTKAEQNTSAESETSAAPADPSLPIRISVLSGSTGYVAVKLMDDAEKGTAGMNYTVQWKPPPRSFRIRSLRERSTSRHFPPTKRP